MGLYFTGLLLTCVFACACVRMCAGSAWLQDPPSRSALWMYGIRATPNYDFRTLDCGGVPVVIRPDGSRNCGICGDPVNDPLPRPNENGGKYADPIIRTRYYEAGSVAEISVRNNLAGISGFYEFRLCTDGDNPTQECFNQNLLTITEVSNTNVDVPQTSGTNVFHVQLPNGVTCTHCMFQWRFRKEKSVAGCDNTNWCGLGRGPQVEFYNCADVIIGAKGQPKPTDPDVLQEPTYDAVDYGSAYDVATTLTTESGASNPGTTHQHTTVAPVTTTSRFNIITVPTAQPPGTTTQGPTPDTGRLVFDSSGNQIPGGSVIQVGGGSSRVNTAPLLLLLGILPILGAATLRDSRPLPVPIAPITSPRGFWVQTPPMSEYYLGANYGFGNFGSNGMSPAMGSIGGGGGSYGSYGESYGKSIGYSGLGNNNGYNVNGLNFGNNRLDTIPRLANSDFASTHVQLREMVQNNGNAIGNGISQQQQGSFTSNNWGNQGVGSSWGNQPVSSSWGTWGSQGNQHVVNQHVSHIRPRSIGEYSKPQQPHSYGNRNMFNQGTFQQQMPTRQPMPTMQPNVLWTRNNNNINNVNNNRIPNNNNNINGVTSGQRFPVQGTIPRPTVSLTPTQRSPVRQPVGAQPPALPAGVESASRFQQSTRTISVQGPGDRPVSNGRQLSAHDWYYRLMGQVP